MPRPGGQTFKSKIKLRQRSPKRLLVEFGVFEFALKMPPSLQEFIFQPFRCKSNTCTKEQSNHKKKKKNMGLCVIRHRFRPLWSTALNAYVINASLDGLSARTHTDESFSCWYCCNSFRVCRARCGSMSFYRHGGAIQILEIVKGGYTNGFYGQKVV